ncbi:hypothetical protein E4K72_14230 [Oxalobacteraceae bacterium OM1]|nr:hypothetical protein E4K72_14230 [Oxalobacteraceae bacterium OM1]
MELRMLEDPSDYRSCLAPLCTDDEADQGYLALDLETGKAWVAMWKAAWVAVPEEIWFGRTRYYEFTSRIRGDALADLLADPRFRSLLQRVLDGASFEEEQNNHYACLNEDAQAAEDEVTSLIARAADNIAYVWDVGEWLFLCNGLSDVWRGECLTAAVGRLERERAAEAQNGTVVFGDIRTALLDRALDDFHEENDLSPMHVCALLAERRITLEQAGRWRSEYVRTLSESQVGE